MQPGLAVVAAVPIDPAVWGVKVCESKCTEANRYNQINCMHCENV